MMNLGVSRERELGFSTCENRETLLSLKDNYVIVFGSVWTDREKWEKNVRVMWLWCMLLNFKTQNKIGESNKDS